MLLFVLVVGARVVFLVFLVEGFGIKVPSLFLGELSSMIHLRVLYRKYRSIESRR